MLRELPGQRNLGHDLRFGKYPLVSRLGALGKLDIDRAHGRILVQGLPEEGFVEHAPAVVRHHAAAKVSGAYVPHEVAAALRV